LWKVCLEKRLEMITISSYWNLLFMLLLLNLGLNLDTGADQVSGMAIHSLKICVLSLSFYVSSISLTMLLFLYVF
jgi:hypothetical protein